jgi:uncharacterized protein YqkB
MKIYIDSVTKDCTADSVYKKHMIYSTDGIFCLHNKKLTMVDIITNATKNINIMKDDKPISLVIEDSREIFLDTIMHIPYNHIYCEETYEKTHIGHDIFYIKCIYFDQISHYFEVDRLEDYMYDIMISFLFSN